MNECTCHLWCEGDRNDKDRSGYISKEEMFAAIGNCSHLGGSMEEEAKKCLDDIDVDGDGRISYPEFLLVWKFKY